MSKKPQQPKQPEEPLYSIQVKFDRSNATYKPEQTVSGSVMLKKRKMVNFSVDVQYIKVLVSGKAKIQNRQNKKIIQELMNCAQKIVILNENITLSQKRTITQQTSVPFKFKLTRQPNSDQFLQSYVGVFMSIVYDLSWDIKFVDPQLQKIKTQTPFYIQIPNAGRQVIQDFQYPKPKHFIVRSQDIKNQMAKTHRFQLRGYLESEIIHFSDYVLGGFTMDFCEPQIRSIDLQMLRNESIQSQGKNFNEVTEIQLIQLCDGDITRGVQLPIYMILPRYYSCPSIKYKWITLTFEINLVVGFKDGYKVTANIPLKLIRS